MPSLALLAGGLATRLGELTASVPKSLLPVAGEPFLAHQLRRLAGEGVEDVVICCGHLGDMIEDFAGDGSRFGCRLRYSCDGPDLLGTGGAVRRALPLLGELFWVMYGDSYLTVPFAPVVDAFQAAGKPALMTVFANEGRWGASNVELSAGKIVRYEKRKAVAAMRHIDYGLSLFTPRAFAASAAEEPFDLGDLQKELVESGDMACFEAGERFYEIGSLSGIEETNAMLLAKAVCA
ncbi:sugar phosphate nucleotidyltransferase [Silvibacterium acidisoli]|uniref:sugar phosphate nucleotidyltransferase n=1 Tax=Acidobacteriaceae bacterium ZG23-2 TaxID=2883246 RepID=UPI00406CE5FE